MRKIFASSRRYFWCFLLAACVGNMACRKKEVAPPVTRPVVRTAAPVVTPSLADTGNKPNTNAPRPAPSVAPANGNANRFSGAKPNNKPLTDLPR